MDDKLLNGDLVVANYIAFPDNPSMTYEVVLPWIGPVKELDLSVFTQPAQMTAWEYAAYHAYGDDACERDGINTLEDLFGTDFWLNFIARKNQMIALQQVKLAEAALDFAKRRLAYWQEQAVNPTAAPLNFSYYEAKAE
jgi:hypothetical protein